MTKQVEKTLDDILRELYAPEQNEARHSIIVITGASGSGKTTVANLLIEEGLSKLVTTTSRPMRPGEVDGVDYHFIDEEAVDHMDYLESTNYNGYRYGLTMHEIQEALNAGKPCTVVMDRNGAEAMKRIYPQYTRIVHLAVSKADMAARMRSRGDEEASVHARLRHAEETGEFDPFDLADLTLEGLSPEETVQWVLGLSEGKKQENKKERVI